MGSTIGSLIDSWIIPAAFPFYSLPRSLIGLGSRTKAVTCHLKSIFIRLFHNLEHPYPYSGSHLLFFLAFVTDAQDDSLLYPCSLLWAHNPEKRSYLFDPGEWGEEV
uniref:Uncharacterized protein n=1 Tax=Micrurus lemniscatus lemniscatus TaxID=129467 RepID=A0A2D4I050_MICLE